MWFNLVEVAAVDSVGVDGKTSGACCRCRLVLWQYFSVMARVSGCSSRSVLEGTVTHRISGRVECQSLSCKASLQLSGLVLVGQDRWSCSFLVAPMSPALVRVRCRDTTGAVAVILCDG